MNNLDFVTQEERKTLKDLKFVEQSQVDGWIKIISNIVCPKEISTYFLEMGISIDFNYKYYSWDATVEVADEVGEEFYKATFHHNRLDAILKWCNEQENKLHNNELKLSGKKIGYQDGLKWGVVDGHWRLYSTNMPHLMYAEIHPHFEVEAKLYDEPKYKVMIGRGQFEQGMNTIYCASFRDSLMEVHEHYPLVVLED